MRRATTSGGASLRRRELVGMRTFGRCVPADARDEQTGEEYLRLPVPPPEVLDQAWSDADAAAEYATAQPGLFTAESARRRENRRTKLW